jgi:hypothetical protein
MKVIYLVKSSTGFYEVAQSHIVAAYLTQELAQEHCNTATAQAKALVAADPKAYRVSDTTALDLSLEVLEGRVSYRVEPVLLSDSLVGLANLFEGASALSTAIASLKKNAPAPSPAPVSAFAAKLASALTR